MFSPSLLPFVSCSVLYTRIYYKHSTVQDMKYIQQYSITTVPAGCECYRPGAACPSIHCFKGAVNVLGEHDSILRQPYTISAAAGITRYCTRTVVLYRRRKEADRILSTMVLGVCHLEVLPSTVALTIRHSATYSAVYIKRVLYSIGIIVMRHMFPAQARQARNKQHAVQHHTVCRERS